MSDIGGLAAALTQEGPGSAEGSKHWQGRKIFLDLNKWTRGQKLTEISPTIIDLWQTWKCFQLSAWQGFPGV